MSSNAYYPNPIGNIEINEEKYFDLISDINLEIGNIDGLLEYNDYEKIIRAFIKTDDILSSAYLNQRKYTFEEYLNKLFANSLPVDDFVEIRYIINKFDNLIKREAKKPFSLDFLSKINKELFDNKLKKSIKQSKLISERHPWLIENTKDFDKKLYYQPEQKIINNLMKDLKDFSLRENLKSIIKIAVIYGQLLMIHPFRYANFRTCSLMIPYVFNNLGITDNNIIYLNSIFRKDRDEFYKVLTELFKNNNWELWVEYFLKMLKKQTIRLQNITDLVISEFHRLIESINQEINSYKSKKYLTAMFENPVFNSADLRRRYGLNTGSMNRFMDILIAKGHIKKESKGNFINYFLNSLFKVFKIC